MRLDERHIGKAMQALMMLAVMLLLAGCTSGDEGSVSEEPQPTMLQIYVYAPNHMLPTRGNTDWVKSATEESKVNTLQIWVFEHISGNLVGYFTPPTTDDLNTAGNAVYQMAVAPQFVQNRPKVDVYVLANVTTENCKCAFDANTTRTQLEGAMLKHDSDNDPFGLATKVEAVPAEGLPMTGALRDQKVTGESPVLRIGDGSLATVQLVRAVSKVRFIFSQMKNDENVMRIKSVSLTGDILPKQEYLFLEYPDMDGEQPYTGREYHVNADGGYDVGPIQMVGAIDNVASTTDPLYYTYSTGMGAQEYETLITTGLTKETPELTLGGMFYLRESDKKLTGEIKYTVNDGEEKTATFNIHDAGDFSRNHTWVVYAFYGSTTLDILVVRIKEWVTVQEVDHTVYNW
jgi:hypothetical protein